MIAAQLRLRSAVAALFCTLCACPAPRSPRALEIGAQTISVGRTGALTGVAGNDSLLFAAFSEPAAPPDASLSGDVPVPSRPAEPSDSPHRADASSMTAAAPPASRTFVEARARGGSDAIVWRAELAGTSGPLAVADGVVFAALGGTGDLGRATLRGEPGALVAALDAATGAIRWTQPIDASEWSMITSLATASSDLIVGGLFAGSLRIGARVVVSAGKTDGFVARFSPTGDIAWLIRVGGAGADAVQGVATSGARIAIAGSFSLGADLLGEPLVSVDQRSPASDGFVAELDASGTRRWSASFGGKYDDTIAGVAIAGDRVAVAASVRDRVQLAGHELTAQGPADGALAWWASTGEAAGARLLGGADFDGLRAITAINDHIAVAGFYSGSLSLGDRALTADGGDDAFLATFNAAGTVVTSWSIRGDGREEITSLAAIPGGFVAGVSYSAAANVDGIDLPTPKAPSSGAAMIVRPLR